MMELAKNESTGDCTLKEFEVKPLDPSGDQKSIEIETKAVTSGDIEESVENISEKLAEPDVGYVNEAFQKDEETVEDLKLTVECGSIDAWENPDLIMPPNPVKQNAGNESDPVVPEDCQSELNSQTTNTEISCETISENPETDQQLATELKSVKIVDIDLEIIQKTEETTSKNGGKDSDAPERGKWSNEWDFLFSCISVSVGLGNVWRFPYLCFKNGGGTFLVTYFVAMIFCGIPVFYQEVAIGQYLGVGGMTLIAELAPIMKGVGYATMVIVFFLDIYYSIIVAWTLFYFIISFTALPGLPWQTCENSWNTLSCYIPSSNISTLNDGSVSAVEEFWSRRVLGITDGIEEVGSMRLELLGVLVLTWILVYIIIWKGINESGYIIWFTALFPYVILSVLVVRAVTLDGAADGLLYYVTPKWDLLLTSGPWIDGATQIFMAYSIGSGALPALGSYNKFTHNCYRDAIITCIVNTFTCLIAGVVTFSILGNIATTTNTPIESVVSSGPGLVFITYPEVVLRIPGAPIWAILFFFMLSILGLDSLFCIVEAFVTGVVDNWPKQLRKYRRLFVVLTIVVIFLLSLPMVTEGGVYLFQVMDYYSASGIPLLFLVFFQTISINWIFGGKKFGDCIEQMLGKKPSYILYLCWVFLAPAVMLAIFTFSIVQYTPVTYGNNYQYPQWAEILGLCISLASMLWIPLYAVYYIWTTPGSLREVLIKGVTPVFKNRGELPSVIPEKDFGELKNGPFSSVEAESLDGINQSADILVGVDKSESLQ